MKKLSTIVLGLAALALMGAFLGSPLQAASELVPVYSPPVGGTAYTLGTGIVAVTNKYIPDARLVHEATSGTLDMVKRMLQRDATNKPTFAIFGSPDAWRAYKGEDEYSKKPFSTLRAVVFVNASDQYLVVPANSPIKSYADVKGKRIGIGGPGSTVANSAFTFLEYHGVGKKDFKPFYYNYRESVEGIQNGSLDGGFIGGGYPIAIYTELTLQHNVRIVPLDEEVMKKAVKEHPYYYRGVVKAKSYKGLENDTTIYGFTTVLWTLAGVPNDFVYNMLKNLFDHKEDYYAIHKSARDLTKEDAAKGVPLPFHPGAEKYLKEIGAIK